jgi:hypothetical protein
MNLINLSVLEDILSSNSIFDQNYIICIVVDNSLTSCLKTYKKEKGEFVNREK